MPGKDGTGPRGAGPETGWGCGPCCVGVRRGLGSRGFYGSPVVLSKDEQKDVLENQKAQIEAELKAIKDKLKEIE